MATVQETLANPDFQSIKDDDVRIGILSKVDPQDYANLPREVQLGIINKGKSSQPTTLAPLAQIKQQPQTMVQRINAGIDKVYQPMQKAEDLITDFARPAIGTAVGGLTGTGAGGYLATDMLMQHLKNHPDNQIASNLLDLKPGGVASTAVNAVENFLGGKVIDKAVGAGAAYLKEKNAPGSVVGDIYKLSPTYSQYYGGKGVEGSLSQWMENVLASSSKLRALATSAQKGYDAFADFAGSLSGRARDVLEDTETHAGKIAYAGARSQARILDTHINRSTDAMHLIGELNPNQVIEGYTSSATPVFSQRAGPVGLNNVQKVINDFKASMPQQLTEADKSVVTAISRLEDMTKPVAGYGLNSGPRPVSIQNALDYRQTFSELADSANSKKIILGNNAQANDVFARLKSAIDDDIETSMARWPKGSQPAMQAFDNQRFLEGARKQVFETNGLTKLLESPNATTHSVVNDILKNPDELQQVINSGQLQIPDAKGVMRLQSSNIRQDLQGYRLMQILRDNSTMGADGAVSRVNVQGMRNAFNDPDLAKSTKILFGNPGKGNPIDTINSMLDGLAQTQTAVPKKIGLGKDGLVIAGSLLGSYLSPISSGVAAIRLGGGAIAKFILNNPDRARLMVALSKGEPMGMSLSKASELIAAGLKGLTVAGIDQAGNSHDMVMGKDGKLTPAQ